MGSYRFTARLDPRDQTQRVKAIEGTSGAPDVYLEYDPEQRLEAVELPDDVAAHVGRFVGLTRVDNVEADAPAAIGDPAASQAPPPGSAEAQSFSDEELRSKHVSELRGIAARHNVANVSSLNKDELVEAISQAQPTNAQEGGEV